MPLIEFSSVDAHVARVCDPATANRYDLVCRPVGAPVFVMRDVLPGDVGRAKEALTGQGIKFSVLFHGWGQRAPADGQDMSEEALDRIRNAAYYASRR